LIATTHIAMDPAYRDALHACALDRVESVLERVEGRVVAWSRTTDTLYVPAAAVGGAGFYLKRYVYPDWARRVRGALRGTFFGLHRAAAERRLLKAMRDLGLSAVRPVAHGWRRVGHFLSASFLITEEVPGAVNLTVYARRVLGGSERLDRGARVRFITALARNVAELHASGFAHGQLFWRNILVRRGLDGEFEFHFLDPRPRRWLPGALRITGRAWLHELGQLTASALPFSARSDRVRFLRAYLDVERLPSRGKAMARDLLALAEPWRLHERQRIRMSDRFTSWEQRLRWEEQKQLEADGEGSGAPPASRAAGGAP
jgi:hypothetical protein